MMDSKDVAGTESEGYFRIQETNTKVNRRTRELSQLLSLYTLHKNKLLNRSNHRNTSKPTRKSLVTADRTSTFQPSFKVESG